MYTVGRNAFTLKYFRSENCLMQKSESAYDQDNGKRLVYSNHLPSVVVIRRFYFAYIRPRLEYCSAVWDRVSHALLTKLERVQLKIAHLLVTPAHQHLSGKLPLEAANLPTLAWRRREHRLTILWKLINKLGPTQLSHSLPLSASSRSVHSLRAPHRLQFPVSCSSSHLSSFFCVNILEWNSLPPEIVKCSRVALLISSLRQLFSFDKFSFGLS